MVYVEQVTLDGYRGISGTVKFKPGLNIILGPNNSGKTTLLESIILPLILNHTNVRETYTYIQIYESARGSIHHAFYSLANKEARVCLTLVDSISQTHDSCAKISVSDSIESFGNIMINTANITISSESRNCNLIHTFKSNGNMTININIMGKDCHESSVKIGAIPSGITPYNSFDTIIGHLKRQNPELVDEITINLSEGSYKLDLSIDAWNRAVVIVKHRDREASIFYSVGRGLQRAFQILFLTLVNDILLIDEIESAMHPELLRQVSSNLVKVMGGRQVIATSQSLEAATALASAVINPERATTDRYMLLEMAEHCRDPSLTIPLRVLELARVADRLKYMAYDGCEAVWHVAGAGKPRRA